MTTTQPTAVATTTRGRAATIALWTLQILFAAFFAFAAIPKLLGDPTAVESFETIGFGQWFRYLTGAVELAGAIGLLIPRLSGLAALGLAGVMVGATLTNLFLVPDMAVAAIATVALGAVFVLMAWARRAETRELIATLRGTAR
jgi:uncharacterized membrane protein YphA (DoxX/SURF4 family)